VDTKIKSLQFSCDYILSEKQTTRIELKLSTKSSTISLVYTG